MPTCIVGRCENKATVRMSLTSFGQTREADFCERCARDFEGCWHRVNEADQLQLEIA